jgi:hypothetical protein
MLDPIYDIKLVIIANALEIASSGDVNAQGRFVLIEVFALRGGPGHRATHDGPCRTSGSIGWMVKPPN